MKPRTPCTHAHITPGKNGKIVMRKYSVYPCLIPAPELPVLPASITKAYGFNWPPHRSYVSKEDCEQCPCWASRSSIAEEGKKP